MTMLAAPLPPPKKPPPEEEQRMEHGAAEGAVASSGASHRGLLSIEKPVLAVALGITLWPAAAVAALVGTPLMVLDSSGSTLLLLLLLRASAAVSCRSPYSSLPLGRFRRPVDSVLKAVESA
jgi:hypothetical protein